MGVATGRFGYWFGRRGFVYLSNVAAALDHRADFHHIARRVERRQVLDTELASASKFLDCWNRFWLDDYCPNR